MVLISISVPLDVSAQRNIVKEKQLTINKINKLTHYCNFPRVSFFKTCVKEAVVVAILMFEVNLLRIFEPKNDIHFCPLLALQNDIFNVICNLVLYLFREGIKMLFR